MPTSSVGAINRTGFAAERGVTLIEMLIVVTLIALMAGLSFPRSRPASIRCACARPPTRSSRFSTPRSTAPTAASRRSRSPISKADNSLEMRSREPGFYRKLQLPDGVSIVQVLPQLPEQAAEDANLNRDFLLYPGGTVPPLGVQLINRRNCSA